MSSLRNVYHIMHKASNLITRLLEIIIVLLVVINAADVFLQVFNRYILVKITNVSFSWTDELARYSMIWICYCTLGICFREGSMAQVDLVYNRLNRKNRLLLYIVTRILMAMVLVVSIKYGLYICQIKKIYRTAMLRAPGLALYTAPIVGSVLVGFEMLTELAGVLSGELEPFEAGTRRDFPRHAEPQADSGVLPEKKEDC